jgi:ABC-2 type transport system ATP-binding protein
MWNIIKRLMKQGTTILLTTQYLEEADQLADRIVVIDGGKVIAEGTAAELKGRVGKDRLELTLEDPKTLKHAIKVLDGNIAASSTKDTSITMVIDDINSDVKNTLERLAKEGIEVASLAVHKPTLDDVFLTLTGKQASAQTTETEKEEEN